MITLLFILKIGGTSMAKPKNAFRQRGGYTFLLSLTLGFLLLLGGAGAQAAPTLDQVSDGVTFTETGFYNALDRAQTFTVGLTGLLTQVDIKIHGTVTFTEDVLFDVRTTFKGIPTEPNIGANILFNAVIPPAAVPEVPLFGDVPWTSVFLGAGSFPVTAGSILAISLRTNDDQVYWLAGSYLNPFPSGIRYSRDVTATWIADPESYIFFRTWVDVATAPAPSTLLLLGSGMAGLGLLRRRRS
jgi:hypothetical protein